MDRARLLRGLVSSKNVAALMPTRTFDSPAEDEWWAISGTTIRAMLQRVATGEDPEMVYLEEYVNSDHTHLDPDDATDDLQD